MENTIKSVIWKRYHVKVEKMTFMGGGFYGRVFLVEIPCEPNKIVIKLYLIPGFSQNEYRQIEALSKSALLKMPKLFWMEPVQEDVKYEVLAMEYLRGFNAGEVLAEDLTDQPETLIITAEYDLLRDEGEDYGRKLKLAGNKVEIYRLQDAIHGFISLMTLFPEVRACYKIINRFLGKGENHEPL